MYTFKEYIKKEIVKSDDKISWIRAYRKIKNRRERYYLFWYRASYVLHRKDSKFLQKLAKRINKKINFKFCCDFHRKSEIDIGLDIGHLSGIVIAANVKIGKNFKIRQNTTVGLSGHNNKKIDGYDLIIGDNVDVGANTCIIGNGMRIGDNVIFGAMSFVNENIDSNITYITKKQSFKKNHTLNSSRKCTVSIERRLRC